MQFNAILISALATYGMANPSTNDYSPLEARDLGFTVKFHATDNYKAPGPARNYDAGSCLPLGDTARGLEIIERKANCYVSSYTGGTCNGNGRNLDANGCWTLAGRQSIRFNCS